MAAGSLVPALHLRLRHTELHSPHMQAIAESDTKIFLVFDQQYVFIHSVSEFTISSSCDTAWPVAIKCSVKTLPTPRMLLTCRAPAMASAMRRAKVNPRPAP